MLRTVEAEKEICSFLQSFICIIPDFQSYNCLLILQPHCSQTQLNIFQEVPEYLSPEAEWLTEKETY